MAFTEKQLGQGQITNSGTTTLYTVPASTKAVVKCIDISNTTSSNATISIWLVPSGSSAADANNLRKTLTIPANDGTQWEGYQILSAGATIQATAGTATAITITVSGAEIT